MLSQQVADTVSSQPALRPNVVTLPGRFVNLERLRPEHASQIYKHLEGEQHAGLWTYMPDGPWTSLEDFQESVNSKSQSIDPFFYAIIDNASNEAVGHAALMRIDTANRVIEVGFIMFSPALQQTKAATEAMYLIAKHVFDDLGYRRYEWKCNDLNDPSRRAAARLGFTFEGVFRQHMIVKGLNRDTAWFSMLDGEWPKVKTGFELWLEDSNFDAEGRQTKRLQDLRRA